MNEEIGSGLSEEELGHLRFQHLKSRIETFIEEIGAEDFAMTRTPLRERTQFKHKHQAKKQKGGSPPQEFSLVEAYVDLQLAVEEGKWGEAVGLFYYLKRRLNR